MKTSASKGIKVSVGRKLGPIKPSDRLSSIRMSRLFKLIETVQKFNKKHRPVGRIDFRPILESYFEDDRKKFKRLEIILKEVTQ